MVRLSVDTDDCLLVYIMWTASPSSFIYQRAQRVLLVQAFNVDGEVSISMDINRESSPYCAVRMVMLDKSKDTVYSIKGTVYSIKLYYLFNKRVVYSIKGYCLFNKRILFINKRVLFIQ